MYRVGFDSEYNTAADVLPGSLVWGWPTYHASVGRTASEERSEMFIVEKAMSPKIRVAGRMSYFGVTQPALDRSEKFIIEPSPFKIQLVRHAPCFGDQQSAVDRSKKFVIEPSSSMLRVLYHREQTVCQNSPELVPDPLSGSDSDDGEDSEVSDIAEREFISLDPLSSPELCYPYSGGFHPSTLRRFLWSVSNERPSSVPPPRTDETFQAGDRAVSEDRFENPANAELLDTCSLHESDQGDVSDGFCPSITRRRLRRIPNDRRASVPLPKIDTNETFQAGDRAASESMIENPVDSELLNSSSLDVTDSGDVPDGFCSSSAHQLLRRVSDERRTVFALPRTSKHETFQAGDRAASEDITEKPEDAELSDISAFDETDGGDISDEPNCRARSREGRPISGYVKVYDTVSPKRYVMLE